MNENKQSKWLQTMIEKHGSEEAVREAMKNRGSKGGQAKVPKGFATNVELAKKVGGWKTK